MESDIRLHISLELLSNRCGNMSMVGPAGDLGQAAGFREALFADSDEWLSAYRRQHRSKVGTS